MSPYNGAKARVRVDSELSEEFEVNVGIHQGFMPSHVLLAVEVDVTEFTIEGVLSELLYVDDLVLMNDKIEGLRNKFLKWKEAFESKGMKFNFKKTKEMVSSIITQDDMSEVKLTDVGLAS